MHWTCCTARNEYSDTPAQKELTQSSEELYYPILDRIHESLHEKYIEGLYKKKIGSPYSVTIGNNLDPYGEMLASSLIVSMYNGSLTHILLIYEKIRDFVFYLSCKYDDWNLRLNLYKLAIFAGSEKEIKGIQDSFPEVLNNLTADEAKSIMDFCLNHPIKYKRLSSQLLAFGSVGYFLDDKCYKSCEKSILGEIKSWLSSDTSVVAIGQNIFKCLSGVAYRMSQDMMAWERNTAAIAAVRNPDDPLSLHARCRMDTLRRVHPYDRKKIGQLLAAACKPKQERAFQPL